MHLKQILNQMELSFLLKYIFIIFMLIYIVLLNKKKQLKINFVKIKTHDNKKSISQKFLTTQEEKQLVQ